jgi:hypothetical protein
MNALVLLAAANAGHEPGAVPTVLLALAFAIVCAKLAGELVDRLGQPANLRKQRLAFRAAPFRQTKRLDQG